MKESTNEFIILSTIDQNCYDSKLFQLKFSRGSLFDEQQIVSQWERWLYEVIKVNSWQHTDRTSNATIVYDLWGVIINGVNDTHHRNSF